MQVSFASIAAPPAIGAWRATSNPPLVLALAVALSLVGVAVIAAGADVWRVVVLLAIAPLVEEVVFRAGLHETLLLRLDSPWVANVATAVAFGAAHAGVRGDVAGFLVVAPALVIGYVYAHTRRLGPCMVLHAAMNAAWLVAALG